VSAARVLSLLAVVALLGGVGALLAVELARGARDLGEIRVHDPCEPREPYPGTGFDATLQRIALSGLDGAACSLRASREELVLSFVPEVAPLEIRWDRPTITTAVRTGLTRAVDDAERLGELTGFRLRLVREVVQRAPIDFLIDGGVRLEQLLSANPDPLDRQVLADAIRAALLGAVEDARERGSLNAITGPLVREVVERLPTQALVDIGLRTVAALRDAPDPTDREAVTEAVRDAIVATLEQADADGDLPGPIAFALRELVERIPVEPIVAAVSRLLELVG
jgi:hypothetical protein